MKNIVTAYKQQESNIVTVVVDFQIYIIYIYEVAWKKKKKEGKKL